MKNFTRLAVLLTIIMGFGTGVASGASAVVTLRPTHIDLSATTSESAVLMTLSGYTSNDAKYRLYNGSNQYNCWDATSSAYITSTSYSSGPSVIGTPSTSTTFWILFQRGSNNSATASYRDRLSPYSTNYQTVALPSATSIATPFTISGTFAGTGSYTTSVKYVALAFNGTTLVSASSTALSTGDFSVVCPDGTTIDKIEIRAVDNTLITSKTGSWTSSSNVGSLPEVLTPSISTDGSLSAFSTTEGVASASQSYTVSGDNLTADVTVTAPASFEVSTDDANFSSSVVLAQSGGNLTGEPVTVYVRVSSGATAGSVSGDISHESTGATPVNVAVSGTVNSAEPTSHPTSFSADAESGSVITLSFSAPGTITDAAGYVILRKTGSTPTGVPSDGMGYTQGGTIDDATVAAVISNTATTTTDVTGLSSGTHYYFTVYPYNWDGSDASTYNYKTDGTPASADATTFAPLATPTASAATDLKTTSFTANWETANGATSYRLDVSDQETFATTGSNITDLIISEYVEGSASNKYIEIYNGTGATVDLSDYNLQLYANGSATTTSNINLSGTLTNGAVVVYKNSSAALTLPDGVTATNNSAVNFNGDDAVALYKVSTASYVDIIGRIGEDPGTAWTSGTYSTLDKTLVRKSTVSGGITTNPVAGFPTLETEWDQYNQDDVSHLGSHTFSGGSSPSFIAGYEDLTVSGTSQAVTGLTPNTTYYYRVRATDGSETTGNSNTISVTTASSSIFTGTGNWTTDGNWSAGVPGGADAIINGTVTVDDVVECDNLTVSSSGSLTVGASNGLSVNGNLLIESDATGTGSFIGAASDYAITGTTTVQKYISGASEAWHFLSSPVSGQEISGDWTPSGSYPDGTGYDLYAYYEPSNAYVNRKNTIASPVGDGPRFDESAVNNGFNFLQGKGYMIAYQATNPTKTFTGTLNEGAINITLSDAGTSLYTGANLVGNPYPSAIDWKAVSGLDKSKVKTETGGGRQFYVWNVGLSNYGVYNDNNIGDEGTNGAGRYIAPMQGFWVVAATGGGTMTFNNDARIHNGHAWMKSGNSSALSLRVTAPEQYGADEAMLEFGHTSSVGGATKKFSFVSTAPSLYVSKENEEYSIDYLTTVAEHPEVDFKFKAGVDGTYTLSALSGLDAFERVTLHDLATGTDQELKQDPSYTFSATTSDSPNRFKLTFGSVGILPVDKASVSIYAYNNRLTIRHASNALVEIINLAGQVAERFRVTSDDVFSRNLNLPAGTYVVRVVSGNELRTERIVVY